MAVAVTIRVCSDLLETNIEPSLDSRQRETDILVSLLTVLPENTLHSRQMFSALREEPENLQDRIGSRPPEKTVTFSKAAGTHYSETTYPSSVLYQRMDTRDS
jgi:hypothetical protein